MNLSDIAFLKIHGVDYRCITTGISKGEVENLLLKADLNKKKLNIIKHKKIIFIYKMGKEMLILILITY